MVGDDPRVFTLSTYTSDYIYFTLDSIRSKALFPEFTINMVKNFLFEKPGLTIEIGPKSEAESLYVSSFSSLILTKPFIKRRGVDNEKLNTIVTPFSNLSIANFVNDDPLPADLAAYGLDNGVNVFLEVEVPDQSGQSAAIMESISLRIGAKTGDLFYAQKDGSGSVFTIAGMDPVISANPFTLADKFALILNIDTVSSIEISGEGRTIRTELSGTTDEPVYKIDGKTAEDKSYRNFYQAVIGLLADAEARLARWRDRLGGARRTAGPTGAGTNTDGDTITLETAGPGPAELDVLAELRAALADDLDTPRALAALDAAAGPSALLADAAESLLGITLD
jgi:hypothetical protein